MSKYSEINIGESAYIEHTISESDIKKFVELSGDNNRLHLDENFSRLTSFKKPVAHGMIGASFISTIIGTKLPGDGALWYSQNLEFILPVRIGDKLKIVATVINKNDREKIIELQTDIFNQHKQIVTKGVSKVKVIEELDSPETVPSRCQVALILGSTGGIGEQTAISLAKDGYSIILHYYKNVNKANKLKKYLEGITDKKIIVVQADVINNRDINNMVSEITRYFKSISVFVNATTLYFGNIKIDDMEWKDISDQININIKSNFEIVKILTPLMQKNNYGKIVFLTSMATEQHNSEWLHYITAKSALNGFAKALAMELAKYGIRVNLVSAGMTNTDLISNIPKKVKLLTIANTPLKKIAEPEDIANAISYLVSDKSDFLTGETIRVNGGQVKI
jgi:3-oxoacyl-[acyl-carrier protein] reductase